MQKKLRKNKQSPCAYYSTWQLRIVLILVLLIACVATASACFKYIIVPSLNFICLHLFPALELICSQLFTTPYLFLLLNFIILIIFVLHRDPPRTPDQAPSAHIQSPCPSPSHSLPSVDSSGSQFNEEYSKTTHPSLSSSLSSTQSSTSQLNDQFQKLAAPSRSPSPSTSLSSARSSSSQLNDGYEKFAANEVSSQSKIDDQTCSHIQRGNNSIRVSNSTVMIMQLTHHGSGAFNDHLDNVQNKSHKTDSVTIPTKGEPTADYGDCRTAPTDMKTSALDIESSSKEEEDHLISQQPSIDHDKLGTNPKVQMPMEDQPVASFAHVIATQSSYSDNESKASRVCQTDQNSTSTYSEMFKIQVHDLIIDRPLPSSRFGGKIKTDMSRSNSPLRPMSRLSACSMNEMRSSSPVRISKPASKKGDTLDAIWKQICENKNRQPGSPLKRHQYIPHCGSHTRMNSSDRNVVDGDIRASRPSSPLSPMRSRVSRVGDVDNQSEDAASSAFQTERAFMMKRRTSSIPVEELNAKFDSFISRFHEQIRIQREESLVNSTHTAGGRPINP